VFVSAFSRHHALSLSIPLHIGFFTISVYLFFIILLNVDFFYKIYSFTFIEGTFIEGTFTECVTECVTVHSPLYSKMCTFAGEEM
jgi:hypothetical protein